ncbi:aliphatic sulfonate ABC transporter substrate-binding protein [bacterium 1xD42-87]|jgi:NitT/TauT family transport system substrate-binding protein|nr:aliphatic sulfonate ABC transporter substrate-binding protein [bacterium 1xD42-87]
MKKKVLCVVILAMLFLCVGCVDKGTEVVNIGYFNNITHAQALLMKSEKTLEQQLGSDVEVKWTAFNAGPAEVEALFAGDIDIGYIGPVPALTANVKSSGDVQVLAGATKGGAVLVCSPSQDISGVEDLDGKTVSIPQLGNTQHLSLLKLLSDNGLAPVTSGGSVNVSAVSNADVANTMNRGDIDAALVPEPWGATLIEDGAKVVLEYDEIYLNGDYDVAVVVVRKEFAQKHPDIVEQFLQVHEETSGKLMHEKEDSLKKINQELLDATGKSLSDSIISEAFTRINVGTDINKESMMGFAGISKEQGFISEIPEEEQLYAAPVK